MNRIALSLVSLVVVAALATPAVSQSPGARTGGKGKATAGGQAGQAGQAGKPGKAARKPRPSKLKRLNRDTVRATNDIFESYIKAKDPAFTGRAGSWSFKVDGIELAVITDERADRMRIIAPVVEVADLDKDVLITMLEANFDRALDAKYSVWRGAVWAVYTHPLSPTTKEQFDSAARQVAQLVRTFGTTYSSLDIVFGG